MRRALIVGIDDYPEVPLSGCVNDARKILNVLSRNEDGTPNFDCRMLLAPTGDVTRYVLRENIKELLGHEAELALFYFSGHGIVNNLGGYLVTQDYEAHDEGVAMSEIITLANKARIREVVIILDCCHSGALGEIPIISEDHVILRQGISVLTASGAMQAAIEVGGIGGIFTSLICDALKGGAADVCGCVTVAAVYAYVEQMLGAWDQRPLFKSNISKLVPLRMCKPVIDIGVLRLLSKYFPNADSEFCLDPSFEPEAEPRNEENERIFSHLQKYRAARLLVPVGEEHMYFAAMKSKSCKLTPLGQFYWNLAKGGKL
ncbi:MAG: caspase family protein [Planctomycetes bacterium]|nr:caspase family protein [Planctomycetota bacterium]MBL7144733.1 caspase family protein [Phycisphaerae bacterium]